MCYMQRLRTFGFFFCPGYIVNLVVQKELHRSCKVFPIDFIFHSVPIHDRGLVPQLIHGLTCIYECLHDYTCIQCVSRTVPCRVL